MTLNSLLFDRNFVERVQPDRRYRDHDRGHAFTVGIRFNQEIDFLEVLSFWGEGVGAATYLAAILSNNLFLATTGLLFVVIAIVALVAHLGKAGRFWRVPANLATAWVSRGPFIIAGFFCSGLIWLYLVYAGVQGPYRVLAFLVSSVFAVLLMFYAGWLLGSMNAVKLWNGSLFPVTFVSHSVTSGAVILAGLNWTVSDGSEFTLYISQITLAFLALSFVLTVMHLRRSGNSLAVYASLARLANGSLKVIFLGVALVLGIVVPFFLIAACEWWRDVIAYEFAVTIAVVAVFSRLVGDFTYRFAIVRAGAYEPILKIDGRGKTNVK